MKPTNLKPVKSKVPAVPMGSIHFYDDILKYFNNKPAKQQIKKGFKTITFVTTGIIAYDGGQTTMLHLGSLLNELGYKVYYLSYVPQSRASMVKNAEFNYPGYRGTCVDVSQLDKHKSDLWVATLWESAYIIKNKPGYKLYFVQDYEPYFYAFGDRYQLAKRTYELGLHMISLGPWCAKMIKENSNYSSPIDEINFPVDLTDYPFEKRGFKKYEHKKTVKLAVYTKWDSPRRAPINIQLILQNTQKLLKKKGIELKITYFGTGKGKVFINGKNAGKLTKPEMVDLYHKSDFGIAPSMTNFSLVPFEMMSAGLPFIDFEEGTGSYFLEPNTYLSTKMDEYNLAQTIMQALQQPKQLKEMVNAAADHLQNVTWKKTITDFMAILNGLEPID